MRNKRTESDWSKHTHRVEYFRNAMGGEIRVDHFQEGTKRNRYIKFVNDDEGLSIYGDFGNWIFNRPFIPSKDGYVSDGYWCEKLTIGSTQEHSKYDSEGTREELQRMINTGLEEYGYSDEQLEKSKEWFEELLTHVDDELDYTYEAYRGYNPTDIDYEWIPFVKELNIWLKIIFDAFDEICKRLEDEK